MRSFSCMFLLAACSSSSPGDADGSVALTCPTSVASYCQAQHCDPSLAAARLDRSLCPSLESSCGGYSVISQIGVDISHRYFYRGDQLFAIDRVGMFRGCLAGPAQFDAPSCDPSVTPAPLCSP